MCKKIRLVKAATHFENRITSLEPMAQHYLILPQYIRGGWPPLAPLGAVSLPSARHLLSLAVNPTAKFQKPP